MSWWSEEQDGSRKYIVIKSFNLKVFIVLTVLAVLFLGLMLAAGLLSR